MSAAETLSRSCALHPTAAVVGCAGCAAARVKYEEALAAVLSDDDAARLVEGTAPKPGPRVIGAPFPESPRSRAHREMVPVAIAADATADVAGALHRLRRAVIDGDAELVRHYGEQVRMFARRAADKLEPVVEPDLIAQLRKAAGGGAL